jgi:hypothetical protein
MTVMNVIFDFSESLDVLTTSYTFPYSQQCIDSSSGDITNLCLSQIQDSVICLTVHPNSIFKMVQTGPIAPEVHIENCEFKNIGFNLNGIIKLTS